MYIGLALDDVEKYTEHIRLFPPSPSRQFLTPTEFMVLWKNANLAFRIPPVKYYSTENARGIHRRLHSQNVKESNGYERRGRDALLSARSFTNAILTKTDKNVRAAKKRSLVCRNFEVHSATKNDLFYFSYPVLRRFLTCHI